MATAAVQPFHPVAVLGLINPDRDAITCVGYAPTQGRRCRNPVARGNISIGLHMLQNVPLRLSQSNQLQDELEEAAPFLLCRRYHQDQADVIANGWFRTIRNYTIRNQHTNRVSTTAARLESRPHHGDTQVGSSRLAQAEAARPSNRSVTSLDRTSQTVSAPETQRTIEAARPKPDMAESKRIAAHTQLVAVDAKSTLEQRLSTNDENRHHREKAEVDPRSAQEGVPTNVSSTTHPGTSNITKSASESESEKLGTSRPAQALPPSSSGALSLISASSDNISDQADIAQRDADETEDWQGLDLTPEPSDFGESDVDESYDSDEEMEAADEQLQNENKDHETVPCLRQASQDNEHGDSKNADKQPIRTEPATPAPRQSLGRPGYRPSISPSRSTPTAADWGAEWSRYESSWANLARQDASAIQDSLLYTLPWPVAGGKHRDVTETSVEDFFSLAPGAIVDDDAAYARMLRRHALKWRPERLVDRFGDAKVSQQSRVSRLVKLVHGVVSSLV